MPIARKLTKVSKSAPAAEKHITVIQAVRKATIPSINRSVGSNLFKHLRTHMNLKRDCGKNVFKMI